jgi:hypothetical protein
MSAIACLRHSPGTATIAALRSNLLITAMRRSFPRFRTGVALLIAAFAQSQTTDSIFPRGQLEINGDIASLTVDSDHSKLRITNPEVVRADNNREVVLHAVSTKDGIRVISSASIDIQNKPDDFSFAAVVSERKDVAMVERLLQLGANPSAKTQDGIPALVAAMHMGDQTLMPVTGFDPSVEITTLLLNHGANPDALNKNWQTPLMAAACFGDENLVKLFIDHKANVNIGNKFGMTALMYARTFAKVRMLIAAGASVNDKDMSGKTALYYATARNDPDAVKAELEAGANVNAKDDKGMTALGLAKLNLCCSGPFADEHFREAQRTRSQAIIDILLAAGAVTSGS